MDILTLDIMITSLFRVDLLNNVPVRYVDHIWSLISIEHLYLSGMWQGLCLRMDTEKICVQ